MTLSNAHDYFDRMLNQTGFSDYDATGSAIDFFSENSDGRFTPEFDVVGPVTLSRPREYYGGNTIYGDRHPEEMVIDRENVTQLEQAIEEELSSFEKQVLDLYLTGMGYQQIAKVLARDDKSTDNALQRIKTKLKRRLWNE